MTAFGEAHSEKGELRVHLELRSVNNRHFKLSVRGSEPYPVMEADFEKLLRKSIQRGSVHLQIRVERIAVASEYRLNTIVLTGYWEQLREAMPTLVDADFPAMFQGLASLPGVAPEGAVRAAASENEWEVVQGVLRQALVRYERVRQTEGASMARELTALGKQLEKDLLTIREHLPSISQNFRDRMQDRVRHALQGSGITVEPDHLIREVAIYADRIEVAEELTRLEAHFQQYHDIIANEPDCPGRRLEFVLQEMTREINTTGSKAGDVLISKAVIRMKATLEKIRELVQNVE